MGAFRSDTVVAKGSDMARKVLTALSSAHETRKALRPGKADNAEAEALRTAFEARGYRFRIGVSSWGIARSDIVAASSVSSLTAASRPLMLMEALAAAARAEWASRAGYSTSASGAQLQTVLAGARAMDICTGLQGTLEEIRQPYAVFLSDPLPLCVPAWAWRSMPGAGEGDRVRLHSTTRSMIILDEGVLVPSPTWSTVVSAAREGLVPFREDDVALKSRRI